MHLEIAKFDVVTIVIWYRVTAVSKGFPCFFIMIETLVNTSWAERNMMETFWAWYWLRTYFKYFSNLALNTWGWINKRIYIYKEMNLFWSKQNMTYLAL